MEESRSWIETKAWSLPSDQHDSEASFVSIHPSVSFARPECFRGQRTVSITEDLLQRA